jgi:hypothetical protein
MISYTGFVRAAVFAVVAVVFSSCAGYQMGASRPAAMEGVKTLAVPLFRNNTLEPRASSIVSNNVVRLLHNDGTYKLVDSSLADAVLKGTITRFDRRQLRSARNNSLRTRELELRVWIDYTVETRTGAVLMRGTANGSTSLFLDPNFQLTERQGIDDASLRAAEDLVSRLCEGWGSDAFQVDASGRVVPVAGDAAARSAMPGFMQPRVR